MEDASQQLPVRVQIHPDPSDATRVVLTLAVAIEGSTRRKVLVGPAPSGPEVEFDSEPPASSDTSSEDSSDSESEGGEPMDYDEMRAMISKAYADVDAEDEDEEGGRGKGGGKGQSAKEALVRREGVGAVVGQWRWVRVAADGGTGRARGEGWEHAVWAGRWSCGASTVARVWQCRCCEGCAPVSLAPHDRLSAARKLQPP